MLWYIDEIKGVTKFKLMKAERTPIAITTRDVYWKPGASICMKPHLTMITWWCAPTFPSLVYNLLKKPPQYHLYPSSQLVLAIGWSHVFTYQLAVVRWPGMINMSLYGKCIHVCNSRITEEQGSKVVTMWVISVCYVQELIATSPIESHMDNGISNHAIMSHAYRNVVSTHTTYCTTCVSIISFILCVRRAAPALKASTTT